MVVAREEGVCSDCCSGRRRRTRRRIRRRRQCRTEAGTSKGIVIPKILPNGSKDGPTN